MDMHRLLSDDGGRQTKSIMNTTNKNRDAITKKETKTDKEGEKKTGI